MKPSHELFIGTSGWSYDHWMGPFYPCDLPHERRLAHYVRCLNSTEINNSFYHLPSKKALEVWRNAAPRGFVFAAKASRYITHMKKLKDPAVGVARFLERMSILREELGPILFQLSPHWRFNGDRLQAFLTCLSHDFRYAFELRDKTWLNDQAYELLSRHEAAFCIYELDGFVSPKEITTDFVYIRLHGPAGPYQGSYATQTLTGWAGAISTWQKQGLTVYCYFDNDQAGYAVRNAIELRDMLQRG
jgi:uncharacterized protein YecE (DUF72 family)